jgi:hypothetical protein
MIANQRCNLPAACGGLGLESHHQVDRGDGAGAAIEKIAHDQNSNKTPTSDRLIVAH